MAEVLVSCNHCGFTGTHPGIVGTPPGVEVTMTFVGSAASCPRCGRPARILDGTFRYRDDLVELLAAPGWTLDRLERLIAATEEAETVVDQDPEAAIGLIAGVSKRAGTFLRRVQDAEESREMTGLKTLLKYLRNAALGVAAVYSGGTVVTNLDDIAKAVLDALQ